MTTMTQFVSNSDVRGGGDDDGLTQFLCILSTDFVCVCMCVWLLYQRGQWVWPFSRAPARYSETSRLVCNGTTKPSHRDSQQLMGVDRMYAIEPIHTRTHTQNA